MILTQIANLTMDSIGVQRNIVSTLEDSQKSIFDKIFELTSGALSPDQTFAQKQGIFNALVAKAQGGGAQDIERLLNFTNTFLEAAQNQFKSSEEFQRIFDDVINNILPGISDDAQIGINQANEEIISLEGSLLDLRTSLDDKLTPAIESLETAINNNTQALLNQPQQDSEGTLGSFLSGQRPDFHPFQ
jgi:hypothetical protein